MAKADEAHLLTEKELAKLEKRIAKLYRDAAKEMQTTIDDYFSSFSKRDKEMQSLIGSTVNGKEWTERDYKQWRLNQIGRGKRLEALRDKLAERVTQANETAVAYTNDATPGIYSLNRNYTAYTIEQVSDAADFTLWDEQTVKRLAVEQPDLMPYYPKKQALKRGIDLEYGKKQITASITSSILQGKSIKGIADDLQGRITTMSRASAIRTARTAVTGAQNAGRMDSYKAAEGMGIKLKKEWLATLDGRTRHSHAMLDGQTVDTDKPFKVDGYKIMFPGDRSAPGYLVYNCRCTMIAALDDVDTSDAQRRDRNGLLPDMTYAQWEASKRGSGVDPISKYNTQKKATAKDVTEQYIKSAKKTGKIRYESGYKKGTHKAEIEAAEILHSTFGGKIILLKESNAHGEKTPDYLWNRKLWEQKSISSSKAADSALRVGMKQIHGNAGGVVLSCADGIDYQDLILRMDDRALRGKLTYQFDVVALKNGTFWFARRYKK